MTDCEYNFPEKRKKEKRKSIPSNTSIFYECIIRGVKHFGSSKECDFRFYRKINSEVCLTKVDY